MQFDLKGKMDYYMPRFFETRSRDLLAQASGPRALMVHSMQSFMLTTGWSILPVLVSLANILA
jgi:hypothetical protein